MSNKIIALALNLPMATEEYHVGDSIRVNGEIKRLTEIKDMSIEAESRTETMYDIYLEGKLYKSIVNSPVSITYSLEESK